MEIDDREGKLMSERPKLLTSALRTAAMAMK